MLGKKARNNAGERRYPDFLSESTRRPPSNDSSRTSFGSSCIVHANMVVDVLNTVGHSGSRMRDDDEQRQTTSRGRSKDRVSAAMPVVQYQYAQYICSLFFSLDFCSWTTQHFDNLSLRHTAIYACISTHNSRGAPRRGGPLLEWTAAPSWYLQWTYSVCIKGGFCHARNPWALPSESLFNSNDQNKVATVFHYAVVPHRIPNPRQNVWLPSLYLHVIHPNVFDGCNARNQKKKKKLYLMFIKWYVFASSTMKSIV